VTPLGEEAYEVLRIEAGWPVAGRDYDDGLNPHEAKMHDFIDYDKGCYIGQEVIARLDTYEKVQRHLVGVIIEGDPAAESSKIAVGEDEIGHLTSVTRSPSLNKAIALGYIRSKYMESTEDVIIITDSQKLSGRVVNLPFEIPQINKL
jgi:folate-binding protein YgfZ